MVSESPVAAACREVRAIEASPGPWRVVERVNERWKERYWYLVLDDDAKRELGCIYGDNAVWLERGASEGGNAQLAALAPTLRDLLCGRANKAGALELLELLEWPYTYRGEAFCRVCHSSKYRGHEDYCALAALLRRAAEELGQEEGGGS